MAGQFGSIRHQSTSPQKHGGPIPRYRSPPAGSKSGSRSTVNFVTPLKASSANPESQPIANQQSLGTLFSASLHIVSPLHPLLCCRLFSKRARTPALSHLYSTIAVTGREAARRNGPPRDCRHVLAEPVGAGCKLSLLPRCRLSRFAKYWLTEVVGGQHKANH